MKEKQAQRLEKAMRQIDTYKFRHESCYAKNDAQRNLAGRTHYVDADTLKYFGSRVIRVWMPCGHTPAEGFLYAIVESLKKPGEEPGKTKRAVLFDCFGSVVFRSDFQRTTDKAEKDLCAFVDSFDIAAHYTEKIRWLAGRQIDNGKQALSALAGRLKD